MQQLFENEGIICVGSYQIVDFDFDFWVEILIGSMLIFDYTKCFYWLISK
jgi:hypothetical protein